MKKFFITATGTDIGKTFVTAAISHQLIESGYSVSTFKPIISGYKDGDVNDTEILLKAQGLKINQRNISLCSPWRFRAATSPDYAAKLEMRSVNFKELEAFCKTQIDCDYLFIEGVGGLMVPLNSKKLIIDLINQLKYEVILVAGSYLGSINHTLAAVEILKSRKIKNFKIVISESAENPMPLQETVETIARFADCDIMVLPRVRSGDFRNSPNITELVL